MAKKKEEPSLGGLLGGLFDFLKTIEKLQEKGEEKAGGEEFTLPSGKKARYEYRVSVGHLARRPMHVRKVRGLEKAKEEIIEPEEAKKEPLVDIFDKKDHVLVVAELPNVKEKDLEFKISKNILKIIAKTSGGKIEKDVTVPKESKVDKIENVSFKNNILEIKLRKKKK
ncbi:MAG: Hsp20/alpha crystallin family protein [Nanoarchaeota archaeon]|nr:Hsp20/alpha crystallin family protein [Nanoarchaeota archaeon]